MDEDDFKSKMLKNDSDYIPRLDQKVLNNRRLNTNPTYVTMKTKLLDFNEQVRSDDVELKAERYFG